MSAVLTSTPAGRPSTVATRAGPWDSPAVSQRNMGGILSDGAGALRPAAARRVRSRGRLLGDDDGLADAQLELAKRLATGDGVPQDYIAAHKWANLAAIGGGEEAIKMRDTFAKLMTPDQVADAQKQAREWVARSRQQ